MRPRAAPALAAIAARSDSETVRYKGSVGGFLAPCTAAGSVGARPGPKTGKCSMKIDFDRVDPDARFYGLKKLNFHSMDRDPSMLRDRLGYSLFREFGVAAPRAMHARVLINGKLEGLHVVVEQIDGRFTDSRFSEVAMATCTKRFGR
jgi:spore coat protein CotH